MHSRTTFQPPRFSRSRLIASALACAALPLAGCVSAQRDEVSVRPAAMRGQAARLGVVALSNAGAIGIQVPDSKSDIAQESRDIEFIAPSARTWNTVGRIALMNPAAGAAAAGIALTGPLIIPPLAQEVRRAYGLIVADSAEDVTTARGTLERAAAGMRFEEQLRDYILGELHHGAPELTASPIDATRFRGLRAEAFKPMRPASAAQATASSVRGEMDYPALQLRGVDSILEIKAHEPALSGREGIKPSLAFGVHVRVRVLNPADGQVLYYDYLEYRGATRSFGEWAAEDAKLFRHELAQALTVLSREIVAQVFLRSRQDFIRNDSLAVLGLQRRAPLQGLLTRPALIPITQRTRSRPGR